MSGIGSTCSTSPMHSMANGDAVRAQHSAATEADLWHAHLAVLSHDLRTRKPDGLARLRSEVARLDREVEALMARQKLAERAAGSKISSTLEQVTEVVAERLRRVSDLAGLTRRYGGKPKSEDAGPNAEAAVRPAAIDPIELLFGKGKLTEDQDPGGTGDRMGVTRPSRAPAALGSRACRRSKPRRAGRRCHCPSARPSSTPSDSCPGRSAWSGKRRRRWTSCCASQCSVPRSIRWHASIG